MPAMSTSATASAWARTSSASGCAGAPRSAASTEWWYFVARLDDGAKLVVVFLTKEFTALKKPLSPAIRLDLALPDGTSVRKVVELAAETFSVSTETCDVRIGDNAFVGDLHTYTIRARVEEVEVDITLTGQVPAWRPETGYWRFGEEGEQLVESHTDDALWELMYFGKARP